MAFKILITNFFTTLERLQFFLNKQHTIIRGFNLPSRRSCAKYHLFEKRNSPKLPPLSHSLPTICSSPLLPLQRAALWTAGNSIRAQGPARPRRAVICVQHDDTAVQTDTAEDGGLIAWHHLHEHKLPHTVPLLSPLPSPFQLPPRLPPFSLRPHNPKSP